MSLIRHAAVELIDAMNGIGPWPIGTTAPSPWRGSADGAAACSGSDTVKVTYAAYFEGPFDGGGGDDDSNPVTCPACLRLMTLAQGDRADVIQMREYEAGQARVEAEMERERAIEAAQRLLASGGVAA